MIRYELKLKQQLKDIDMNYNDTDIVVFDGVISTYSVLKLIVNNEKELRFATENEKIIYSNRP